MDTAEITTKDYTGILASLRSRPSRASAAAIGHAFVLNGSPDAVRIRGLQALTEMMCDWAVAVFDEAITGAPMSGKVRRHAISILYQLTTEAISKGYRRLEAQEAQRLYRTARTIDHKGGDETKRAAEQAIEELCNHLSQAVADGCFGQLPDF